MNAPQAAAADTGADDTAVVDAGAVDAAAVDAGAVDAGALGVWLAGRLPGAAPAGAVPSLSRLTGGLSNLTYLVEWGGRRLVVRRPPLGHVLETAHDMGREYRLLSALAPTAVPVPAPYGLCEDPAVIGAPFYAMAWVPGGTFRQDAHLAALDGPAARATTDALVDTLAQLHAVDPEEVGLGGFGRPQGFMERQVRRWRRQWEQSRTRPVPGADELNDRLAAGCPDRGGAALVHGDYKLDNVLFAPDRPGRVNAVLDWEMSTLGDPLADLGLALVYWADAGDDESMELSVGSPVTAGPGFLSRLQIADRYAALTGRDVSRIGYYMAFGCFKLAVVLEGINARFLQHQTVGEGFEREGQAVPLLIERAHRLLDSAQ